MQWFLVFWILVQSKLATSVCLASVLSGKAYAKAIFAIKTVCEDLQYLLLGKVIEDVSAEERNPESLNNLVHDWSREKLDLVIEYDLANAFLQKYLDYEEKFSKGPRKTVTFWLSVKDHSRLMMMLPYSTNVIVIWLICLSLLMVLTILDIWCGWLFSLRTFMRPPRCKKVAPDRWNISSTFSTSRCSQCCR